jgi:PAS domain S-box-containing protein
MDLYRGSSELETQASARKSTVRLGVLVEHVSDLIVLLDGDGRISYVTPSCQSMLGYTAKEAYGRPFLEFVHPDDVSRAMEAMAQGLAHPGELRSLELRLLHRNGHSRVIQALSRNFLHDPEVRGVVVTCRDITEQKQKQLEHERHEREMRTALEQTIAALAATMEARDPYTAGHQRRVAHLAAAIGAELGLDGARLHGLRLAATIHDIGKIRIPSEILTMTRRLVPQEYELVQLHVRAGYEILKGIHFPWPIAEIVLQHHEQMDGTGYPQGLKGDEILVEARILAVADTVEAMNFHRPYRAPLGLDRALDEIMRKRGTTYDPDAVDACVRLFREKGFSFDT